MIPMSYGKNLHRPPTSYYLLAAQQEPHRKANQKCWVIFQETVRRMDLYQKKATVLGRRTGEKIGKPWDVRQEREIRQPWPPFRGK